ncbi:MAG: hypothetical protein KIS66_01465 [Fimbriimonadaceae bacterium]|nr:hypothetical protein [Fimbriimonadaceae bacterium]
MLHSLVLTVLGCRVGVTSLPQDPPVKAFILAGQSNMVGHGFISADPNRNEGKGSLEQIALSPESNGKFKQLLNNDGSWRIRDDVWIHFFDRKGRLTVGYGAGTDTIGPELGFGTVVGDSIREPVVLIKLAWGGKSLGEDFRPPSSGGKVGPFYTEVVRQAQDVMANLGTHFPELRGRPVQLVGFGWHQGWNDRINAAFVQEYEQNMANFIRDVRKDLRKPNLPFVIAETGMGGEAEENELALQLMKAQAAVAQYKEFKGNVAFVGTRAFWRPTEVSPSDQGYHWNSNAETYYLIGDGMGRAMAGLLKRASR